ncbi:MAG: M28 family peptidase, partial [Betaproteobacteria bacterium]
MTGSVSGRIASAAGLLLMCAGAIVYARRVPATIPASAPQTTFSADAAMRHVSALSRAPRPLGSPDNAIARQYILDELTFLGLHPQVQTTIGIGTRYAEAGLVNNVVARLPGTRPGGKAVLLMAHYDGVPAGPAAADDASGCAVLLETLRALRAGPPLVHDVIVLFTDGEEAALLGAAAFARDHPWRADVAVVLNFEARGTHGPSLMFETGPGNLDVVRHLRRVRGVRATSLSVVVYRTLPNDTDLSELAVLGQPAMNFAFIGGVNRYHTTQDDYAHLDPRTVQHHGNQALALTHAFGNGELPQPR